MSPDRSMLCRRHTLQVLASYSVQCFPHSHVFIPIPMHFIPIPMGIPWKSHETSGVPVFPIPMQFIHIPIPWLILFPFPWESHENPMGFMGSQSSLSHALSHSHPMADLIPIPMGIPWDPSDPSLPDSHAHLYSQVISSFNCVQWLSHKRAQHEVPSSESSQRTVQQWNSLQQSVAQASSVTSYKTFRQLHNIWALKALPIKLVNHIISRHMEKT